MNCCRAKQGWLLRRRLSTWIWALLENLTALFLNLLTPLIAPPSSKQQQKSRFHSASSGNSDDDVPLFEKDCMMDMELIQAYHCLGLVRGHCCQEDILHCWKRLSKQHHPDRNQQSRESVERTQQLNHCKDLILNRDFDDEHEQHKNQYYYSKRNGEAAEGKEDEQYYQTRTRSHHQHQQRQEHKDFCYQQKKKWQRQQQQRRGFPNAAQEEYLSDYEEDECFWRRRHAFEIDQSTIQREKVKLWIGLDALQSGHVRHIHKDQQHKNLYKRHYGIDTSREEGRDQAHALWMQQRSRNNRYNNNNNMHNNKDVPTVTHASASSLDGIDDSNRGECDLPNNTTNKPAATATPQTDKKNVTKPIHLTMEQSSNDIIIALRLGLQDTATQMMTMQCSRIKWRSSGHRSPSKAILQMLETPLDEDGNTLWHYSVYYESEKMLTALMTIYCHHALKEETTSGVMKLFSHHSSPEPQGMMLQPNDRGQLPTDFLRCSRRDNSSSLDQRVRHFTKVALAVRKENSLKHRFLALMHNVDTFAVLFSLGMYWVVCRTFFGCSRLLSLIVCFAQSKLLIDEPRERIIYTMMLLGIYRTSIRPYLGLIGYFFWSTWTSLFVSLLVVWTLRKSGIFPFIGKSVVRFNVSVIGWICLRIAILADRLDAIVYATLSRNKKWQTASNSVIGLFYLVLYSSLLLVTQHCGQSALSIVYALFFG